jgi:hypothetical protein
MPPAMPMPAFAAVDKGSVLLVLPGGGAIVEVGVSWDIKSVEVTEEGPVVVSGT